MNAQVHPSWTRRRTRQSITSSAYQLDYTQLARSSSRSSWACADAMREGCYYSRSRPPDPCRRPGQPQSQLQLFGGVARCTARAHRARSCSQFAGPTIWHLIFTVSVFGAIFLRPGKEDKEKYTEKKHGRETQAITFPFALRFALSCYHSTKRRRRRRGSLSSAIRTSRNRFLR
jgi:hypothetical protein